MAGHVARFPYDLEFSCCSCCWLANCCCLCCGLSTRPMAMLLLLLVFLCLQFCRAIGSFSTRSRIGRSCRCGCVVVAVVTAGLKFIECFVAELSNCCEILLDLRKIGRNDLKFREACRTFTKYLKNCLIDLQRRHKRIP